MDETKYKYKSLKTKFLSYYLTAASDSSKSSLPNVERQNRIFKSGPAVPEITPYNVAKLTNFTFLINIRIN